MGKLFHRSVGTLISGFSNLDNWVHSPRTYLMMIAVFLICFTDVSRDFFAIKMAAGSESAVNLGEELFLQSYRGFNLQLSTMTFLVMMSTFPKRATFQEYCMLRSNRSRWFHGQIVYAFLMSALYVILIILFTVLFSVFRCPAGTAWGDFFTSGEAEMSLIWIPHDFLNKTGPLAAAFQLCIPILLCWFTICMILMLFNLLNHPGAGLAVVGMLIIFDYIFIQADVPFSPLHYACGSHMYGSDYISGEMGNMLLFYLIVNTILYILMRVRLSRMDISAEMIQE